MQNVCSWLNALGGAGELWVFQFIFSLASIFVVEYGGHEDGLQRRERRQNLPILRWIFAHFEQISTLFPAKKIQHLLLVILHIDPIRSAADVFNGMIRLTATLLFGRGFSPKEGSRNTMMRSLKAFPLIVLAAALLCSIALLAQNSSVAPRITANVDESSLATLRGNVPRLARAEFDQGETSASTQLTHMRLVLSRSSEQQAALDAYLAQLQDKSSPNYHKWLTPEQFGQLYGPADSDIAALVAWLESHGLQVETVSKGRTNIAFNGTVGQAEEAFHTSIHSFQAGDRQFYSNTTDPQIPSALANVVKGVARLNTIRPRPHSVHGSPGRTNPETGRLEPLNADSVSGARPNLTLGSGTTNDPYVLYMVPGDAATIYNTPNSFNANFSSGTSYTGSGVIIGIGGDATINASTVQNYRSRFLGNSTAPTLNYCTSSSSCSSSSSGTRIGTTDSDEAYIDTELSGGLAPGASIYYYASSDLITGIEAAIDKNVVNIFSLSFGECESDMGSDNALINGWWEQAATQGITVTVSSGDSGSAGCDDPNSQTTAKYGMQVSGYASTPYNIAVGGTNFYALTSSAFTTYASTTNSSSTYYRTALKYIPESTWNDSSQYDTTISANVPYTGSSAGIWAGSGGVSAKYSKPSWQTGTGVPADGMRDIPDVSLMAASGSDNAAWLVCDDERAGSGTANCATQSGGSFYFSAFGGTSTSAPAFAGILALLEQKTGSRLGTGLPAAIYSLYNGSYASSIFHDITVGNISVSCNSGTTNCTKNTAGYYFESGYNTNVGYDLATGLGSVNATQLLNYWSSSTGSDPATVSVTVNTAQPVTTVEIVSVTVSVTGSYGTPGGTVTLAGGGYTSSSEALSSGSYTFSIPAGSLAIGTDTLTATYSGNSTYAATTNSSTSVTVDGITATVTANPSVTSINSSQSLTVSGAVSGSYGTPTGTVTLTGGGYTSSATALSGGSYSIIIPANSLSAGSIIFTVTYSGNSTYASASGTTTSVTVTAVTVMTPTVTVSAASSVDSSQTLSVQVTVSGSSSSETYPTGTVTLTSGTYSSGTVTLSSGRYTFTIPADSLRSGTDTLTATYSGDSYYNSATGTATVTVTKSIFALSATTPSSIAHGASTTSTVTVSSSTLYVGTVTLTCALTTYPSGAVYLPSCSSGSNTVTLSSSSSSGTATVTVSTTAASAALAYPRLPGKGGGYGNELFGAGGGALLAFLFFLGIPARRRSWRSMLVILVMMTALGCLADCGGGGGGGGGGGNSGTTAGTYTFTVTGTGSDTNTTTETTTFTVTVT
jgi:subtilase family serine protease